MLILSGCTVDGLNPAPVGRWFIPVLTRFYPFLPEDSVLGDWDNHDSDSGCLCQSGQGKLTLRAPASHATCVLFSVGVGSINP